MCVKVEVVVDVIFVNVVLIKSASWSKIELNLIFVFLCSNAVIFRIFICKVSLNT